MGKTVLCPHTPLLSQISPAHTMSSSITRSPHSADIALVMTAIEPELEDAGATGPRLTSREGTPPVCAATDPAPPPLCTALHTGHPPPPHGRCHDVGHRTTGLRTAPFHFPRRTVSPQTKVTITEKRNLQCGKSGRATFGPGGVDSAGPRTPTTPPPPLRGLRPTVSCQRCRPQASMGA